MANDKNRLTLKMKISVFLWKKILVEVLKNGDFKIKRMIASQLY